ncbi:MAG: hypothetical protein E7563_07575 [Ruminococcaceae bacterium]|nr:hypothetical protein [Oscillospiraceae bacterium]
MQPFSPAFSICFLYLRAKIARHTGVTRERIVLITVHTAITSIGIALYASNIRSKSDAGDSIEGKARVAREEIIEQKATKTQLMMLVTAKALQPFAESSGVLILFLREEPNLNPLIPFIIYSTA